MAEDSHLLLVHLVKIVIFILAPTQIMDCFSVKCTEDTVLVSAYNFAERGGKQILDSLSQCKASAGMIVFVMYRHVSLTLIIVKQHEMFGSFLHSQDFLYVLGVQYHLFHWIIHKQILRCRP